MTGNQKNHTFYRNLLEAVCDAHLDLCESSTKTFSNIKDLNIIHENNLCFTDIN